LEPGALHGRHVDVEADLLVLHAERDLPAAGREVIDLSHRQDRRSVQDLEDGGEAVAFRGADEEDVAGPGLPDVSEPPDDETSVVHGLVPEGLVEDRPEGIVPEYADHQGVAVPGKGLGGPGDEGGEVIKIGRLDLVLGEAAGGGFGAARPGAAGDLERAEAEEQGRAAQSGAFYHRRTILP